MFIEDLIYEERVKKLNTTIDGYNFAQDIVCSLIGKLEWNWELDG